MRQRQLRKPQNSEKRHSSISFEGYGAEQVKLLDASIIKTKGTYVLFVISPKAETSEKGVYKEPEVDKRKRKSYVI